MLHRTARSDAAAPSHSWDEHPGGGTSRLPRSTVAGRGVGAGTVGGRKATWSAFSRATVDGCEKKGFAVARMGGMPRVLMSTMSRRWIISAGLMSRRRSAVYDRLRLRAPNSPCDVSDLVGKCSITSPHRSEKLLASPYAAPPRMIRVTKLSWMVVANSRP